MSLMQTCLARGSAGGSALFGSPGSDAPGLDAAIGALRVVRRSRKEAIVMLTQRRSPLVLAVVLVFLVIGVPSPAVAAHPDAPGTLQILTQNMDDGTDQTYIIAAL